MNSVKLSQKMGLFPSSSSSSSSSSWLVVAWSVRKKKRQSRRVDVDSVRPQGREFLTPSPITGILLICQHHTESEFPKAGPRRGPHARDLTTRWLGNLVPALLPHNFRTKKSYCYGSARAGSGGAPPPPPRIAPNTTEALRGWS